MFARISFQRFHSPSVLVLLLLLTTIPATEANVRLCGQRLTRALLALCRNQLCGSFAQVKRSSAPNPWWTAPDTSFMETHHSVKRSGIADQCCKNRCSYSYLKTYCCN